MSALADEVKKLKKKLGIQSTKYVDCKGETICYGDILKIGIMEKLPKNKYSPKTPFAMIVFKDGEDMLYISGMDEFMPMEGNAFDKKNPNKLIDLEIFASRLAYESNGAGNTKG